MIIGLDASSLLKCRTGVGHYTYNLLKWLGQLDSRSQYRLLFYSWKIRSKSVEIPQFENYQNHDFRIPGKLLLKSWQYFQFPRVDTMLGKLDLFHSPNYLYQPQRNGNTVCTIHDLSFMKFPGYGEKFGGKYFASVLPDTIAFADGIIVDSHATRDDLMEMFDVSEDRVHVIHLGIDPDFGFQGETQMFTDIKRKLGIGSEYVLAVTTLEPRKNLENIIEALAIYRENSGSGVQLVICGGEGWEQENIYQKIQEQKLESSVFFTGYVDQGLLPQFYSNASVTLFPSLYEGFGLPILESMACSTPVITSNVSSMPEVAGDAAILVNPKKSDEIADAIRKCLEDSDLRHTLVQNGLERVKNFSWKHTASKTLLVYDLVVNSGQQ